MSHTFRRLAAGACLVWLHGCSAPVGDEIAASQHPLDLPGAWSIPPETLAVGDGQHVPYTGAGPWNGGADCAGGLSPGAAIVRAYLLEHFPQTSVIGGYNCRQNTANTAEMSIHAVGRALDVMLPKSHGSADNDLGDPIGNWLIANAETIGIQFVIWDEWTWLAARSPGTKGRAYTGPNPHHDHLHVELSAEAGARTTDWFSGLVTPPSKEGCVALGERGGVIDDLDPCFQSFGAMAYWRHEVGIGHGGSLLWTNAFQSTTPGNWARWNLVLGAAGDYEVEVFLTEPFAVYGATRYAIAHDGVEDLVFVDQGAESAGAPTGTWVSLGVFDFVAGAEQSVSVFDDVPDAVAAQSHVAVDAVRLTRIGIPDEDDGPIDEAPPVDGMPDPDVAIDDELADPGTRRGRGCAAAPGGSSSLAGVALALGALVALGLRRRRSADDPSMAGRHRGR